MSPEEVGKRIKEARKLKNMTQANLAEKLSVSDKAVSKWERGLCFPDLSLLIPLTEELDISLYELLNGEKIEENKVNETLKEAIILSNSEIKKNKKSLSAIFATITIVILIVLLPVIIILHNHNQKLRLQAIIEEDKLYPIQEYSEYITSISSRDGSKIENIFNKLALDYPGRVFDLDNENHKIIIKYKISYEKINEVYGGEKGVKPRMIYDVLVLFGTVQDLETVSFQFKDKTYTTSRDTVINVLSLDDFGFNDEENYEWENLIENIIMPYTNDIFKLMFQ